MEKVSVVLADWQVHFREGIHFTLSDEECIEVISEVTNSEEALNFIEKNPPSVAILNTDRDKLSGIDVTRRIKQNLPAVSVILIMDSDNEEQLFLAVKSGASACLTKDMDPLDLVSIVRKASQGAHPISEALLRPVIEESQRNSQVLERRIETTEKGMVGTQQALNSFASAIAEYAKHLKSHTSAIQGLSEVSLRRLKRAPPSRIRF